MSDASEPAPGTRIPAEQVPVTSASAPDEGDSTGGAPSAGFGSELATLVVLVVAVAVGQSLFFRAPLVATLGPIAGLIAGIGCRRWWSAAIIAAVAVPLGALVAPAIGGLSWAARGVWLPLALEAGLVAAVLGAVIAFMLRGRERLARVVVAVAVIAILSTMWVSAISDAEMATPPAPSAVQRLASTPQMSPQMSDEDLYLIWIAQLREGASYYPMAVRTLVQVQAAAGNQSLVRVRSPFSYRPPTLYLLLSSLPADGISFVIAMLIVCSLGVVAAYFLAGQFASRTTSLLSAIVVASAFVALGTSQLLDDEAWAGIFVLAAVAAFAIARSHPRHSRALQVIAVLLGLLAIAFREIAAPVLVLGLVAALVDPDERSRRTWISGPPASRLPGSAWAPTGSQPLERSPP